MSLENIKRNIVSVEKDSIISLDVMLSLMDILFDDALLHNKVSSIEELTVEDENKLLEKMFALSDILLFLYNKYQDKIAQEPDFIRDEQEKVAVELKEAVNELSKVEAELVKVGEKELALKEKRKELQDRKAAFEKENAKILNLKQEIEQMEADIEKQKEMLARIPIEELKQKHTELSAECTIMNNVASSILEDNYLKECMNKGPDAELTVEENADLSIIKESFSGIDELENWFESLGNRAKALLNVMEGIIDNVVKNGEASTAGKDKK